MTYQPKAGLVGVLNSSTINAQDIGKNWRALGTISTGEFLTISYLGNGIVIAGDSVGHIFRSSDYGTTWTDEGDLTAGDKIESSVYLGNGIVLFSTNLRHTFRSTDFGVTWTDEGVVGTNIGYSYFGNQIVICADYLILRRSANLGTTWAALADMPGALSTCYLENGIGIATISDGHIWRTTNTGTAWTDIGKITTLNIWTSGYIGNGISLVVDNSGVVFRSVNYGVTWSNLGIPTGAGINGRSITYLGNGVVIYTTAGGIVRSSDYGLTWSVALSVASFIRSAAYLDNGRVLAGDDTGVIYYSDVSYRTSESKATVHNDLANRNLSGISAHNSQLVGTLSAYSINASDIGVNWLDLGVVGTSSINSMCYLGNGIVIAPDGIGHIIRSSDYGKNWLDLGQITTGNGFGPCAYLGNGIVMAVSSDGHEIRSIDYGITWADIGDITVDGIDTWSISYLGWGNVVAVTGNGAANGRILQSDDYGLTWASVVSTAGRTYLTSVYLENFIVLVGDDIGHIWRSTNFGVNWTDLGQITTVGNIFRICYLGNGICLFGVTNQHIWRSADYGLTWNDLGVVTSSSPYDIKYCGNGIVIIPEASGTIFRSSDYGLTWTDLSYAFALMKASVPLDNGICIAASNTAHIYRSDVAYKLDEKHPPILDYSFYKRSGGTHYYSGTIVEPTSAISLGANTDFIFAIPIIISKPTKVDRIAVDVTTACSGVCIAAGANVRLGIYRDTGNVYPGSLIVDTGTVAIGVLGLAEIVINQTLSTGLYWLGMSYHTPAVCLVPPEFRSAKFIPILGCYDVIGTVFQYPVVGWYGSGIDYTAGLPNPFVGTSTTGFGTPSPIVALRIA